MKSSNFWTVNQMKKAPTKTELELKQRMQEARAMLPKIDAKDCILLWRKVVNQAVSDAFSKDESVSREAILWFLKDEKYFNKVCEWAQISPQQLRRSVLNKLFETDPKIIEKALTKKLKKPLPKKISLVHNSIKRINLTDPISFIFENQEVHVYVENETLWFNLTHLNGILKFVYGKVVRLVDLDTYISAFNLAKSKTQDPDVFANLKGIYQLGASFKNQNLNSFADWINQGIYKNHMLEDTNFFYLNFQGNAILAWLHKKRLFLHFSSIGKFFPLPEKTTRKEAQQENKHFYVYLNSKQRQFMVQSDLFLQIIESRSIKKKKHQEMKHQLIKWIKEQQQIFEEENK